MNVKLYVLERIIKWLLSGDVFEYIKYSVTVASSQDIPGSEKRAKVLAETKALFGDLADFLVNLGIEVAVTLLKAKLGDLDGK